MKIGLFGGSFNPIHTGHLIVVDQAIEQLGLDKLIVMPAACNPLKMNATDMASPEHRLKMIQLAIEQNSRVEVSDMEIRRGAPSYTIDTVRELKKNGDEIILIIGVDSFNSLPDWYQAEELVSMVTVGIAYRNWIPMQQHRLYSSIKTTMIDIPTFDTSGTEVRGRIKEGRSIRYLVPDVVAEYIRENGLYLTSR